MQVFELPDYRVVDATFGHRNFSVQLPRRSLHLDFLWVPEALNLSFLPNTTTDVVAHTGHWNLKALHPTQFSEFLRLYFQSLMRLVKALAQPPVVSFVSSFAVHPQRLVSAKRAWLTPQRVALWNRLGKALALQSGLQWVDAEEASKGCANETADGIHYSAGGLERVFRAAGGDQDAGLGPYQRVCRQLIRTHRLMVACSSSSRNGG